MKFVKIKDPEDEYTYIIGVYTSKDFGHIKRKLKSIYPKAPPNHEEDHSFYSKLAGITHFNKDSTNVVILFNKDQHGLEDSTKVKLVEFIGTVAHECFHAATRVLEFQKLKLTGKTQEQYASYYEWLFKEVMGIIVT
jgi:predicted oxidoreductase (fatty acid repression mutant protein)